ncbi:hypothetical protein QBC46DRAFT_452556 [Diplogelasinospora grovesii]|uniref:Uncharacterized protein n=1 Tax=Diplogelasinospora grovesii TaxID=303347 RepID=A0AAN6S163_9PEZI|nr:hypothetical protein QBC46DRAFT_452556 [Diplogelasinospora grovesii]
MHVNLLSTLALFLLLATGIQADVTMMLFQDNYCQIPVPGSGWTMVKWWTCDENVSTGWSSAMITQNNGYYRGILTFYTRNNCAVGQPAKVFSTGNFGCLNDFGFVANAVGLTYFDED